MPDVRHVHAYLMRPPCYGVSLHQREPAEWPVETLRHVIVRQRRAPVAHDGHLLAIARVPPDGRIHRAVVVARQPGRERGVRLGNGALFQLARQAPMRRVCLRHDDQPGGVLVQPVHDARPLRAADARQVMCDGQQRVDQRTVRVPRRGMNREPCGLVHDDEVRVLVDDAHRDVLRREIERLRRGDDNRYDVANLHDRRGLGLSPVQRDQPLAHQRGGARPAQRRVACLHEHVEPRTALAPAHHEAKRSASRRTPRRREWWSLPAQARCERVARRARTP